MKRWTLGTLVSLFCLLGCNDDSDDSPMEVDPDCTSVRLTSYEASDSGWCEFNTTHSFLPAFVREGMHLAIGEPWNGSSFDGEPGEACGECWQVDTIHDTRVLMVTNLCPIEGNPLCAGGHFHFDLSTDAGEALDSLGLFEGAAKRVPCPINGDIHVQVNDSNEWGYLRIAFLNHTVPIRSFEVSASTDGKWVPAERSGGAWQVLEGPRPEDGDGIYFRIESVLGESVVSTNALPFLISGGQTHDLGAQFSESYDDTGDCEFTPPQDVYDDEWGGIDEVRWQPNPWGSATISEVGSGCFDGSDSCLRIDNMGQWEGAHFYYRQPFPVSTFESLSLQMKSTIGSGEIAVTPSYDGERCEEQTVEVNEEGWTEVTIDLATACSNLYELNAVTINNLSETFPFTIDAVRFD